MKKFIFVGILAAFGIFGILIGQKFGIKVSKKAVAQKSSYCTNNNTCIGHLISTKDDVKKSAISAPPGFCLHIPVFLYHHIQPEEIAKQLGQTSLTVDNTIFDQQMAYLAAKGYNTISAATLVDALVNHKKLPANTVLITIDDGYLDIYNYAFPILQKYHITANLMIPTGLLGNQLGTNQYYTWDELNQMIGSGLVTAYNHTWSHYALAAGPVSKDEFEVSTAQDQLKQHLGSASPIFVYPYGSGATTPWVISLLQKEGFEAAFSTLYGWYQCDSNIYSLPRIRVGNVPMSSFGL